MMEGLEQLAGAVIAAGFPGRTVDAHARRLIEELHIQNIVLFARNVDSYGQLAALCSDLQELARASGQALPLLISSDQENGAVGRFGPDVPTLPGAMALGATADPQQALRAGEITGRLLRGAGVNMNLAPVLDVNNNPDNPVIGIRSFGDDPHVVGEFGAAFAQGLQSVGVAACGKHFPGHGDTRTDSHLDLPVIAHGEERLAQVEWVPFQRAIAAGIDSIMTAHVVFPALEPGGIPATLSSSVITGLLRGRFGFTGVVVTDCMEMKAIADTVGVASGVVQALSAGADLVMVSHTLDEQSAAHAAVVEAVRSGRLPLSRLQEAADRVAALKRKLAGDRREMPAAATRDAAQAPERRAGGASAEELFAQAREVRADVAQAAVTVVGDERGLLPLLRSGVKRVLLIVARSGAVLQVSGTSEAGGRIAEVWRKRSPQLSTVVREYGRGMLFGPSAAELDAADAILLCVAGWPSAEFAAWARELVGSGRHIVTVALRSPYDLAALPGSATRLALYEDSDPMVSAAVAVLTGQATASGRLPVSIVRRASSQTAGGMDR